MIISLFMDKAPLCCARGRICASTREHQTGQPPGENPRDHGEYQELHTLSSQKTVNS
jgi:hypothetical protein